MAGTIAIDTIQNGSGASVPTTTVINGSAKAWVNFNGTTSPVTIRASFNVGSVAKNGTGDYTVNFTSAMPDVNYATNASAGSTASTGFLRVPPVGGTYTSSAVQIALANPPNTALIDQAIVSVAIFR